MEIVIGVHAIQEHHAGLRVVVRRAHDLVPQFTRAYFSIHPQAIAALIRARLLHVIGGPRPLPRPPPPPALPRPPAPLGHAPPGPQRAARAPISPAEERRLGAAGGQHEAHPPPPRHR